MTLPTRLTPIAERGFYKWPWREVEGAPMSLIVARKMLDDDKLLMVTRRMHDRYQLEVIGRKRV